MKRHATTTTTTRHWRARCDQDRLLATNLCPSRRACSHRQTTTTTMTTTTTARSTSTTTAPLTSTTTAPLTTIAHQRVRACARFVDELRVVGAPRRSHRAATASTRSADETDAAATAALLRHDSSTERPQNSCRPPTMTKPKTTTTTKAKLSTTTTHRHRQSLASSAQAVAREIRLVRNRQTSEEVDCFFSRFCRSTPHAFAERHMQAILRYRVSLAKTTINNKKTTSWPPFNARAHARVALARQFARRVFHSVFVASFDDNALAGNADVQRQVARGLGWRWHCVGCLLS